ncbi:hypothetical protein [Streptomyces cahuitamycinicus]|uniref:rhamnogalacturonan endolyase family protein n=1 Tax=Streptomyces cahuitamycinicus TaxID=2070367 RepID=UPI001FEA27AD|nr:hypothetical protein [Streptomyces cahuitamycinicus]
MAAAGAMILVVGLSQLGTASPGTGTAQGTTAAAARPMENLGRGVVAVRSGESDVLVSWRLLGLDPENIGFNVYRATGDGDWSQINDDVLTDGTNFVDSGADLSQSNSYRVTPVVDGEEGEPSGAFTLDGDAADEPVVRVPLRDGGRIQFVWVGDLTGDGEYDYVIDRQTSPQSIEAYSSEGDFLWEADMGPNSTDQNNIEGGSARAGPPAGGRTAP